MHGFYVLQIACQGNTKTPPEKYCLTAVFYRTTLTSTLPDIEGPVNKQTRNDSLLPEILV